MPTHQKKRYYLALLPTADVLRSWSGFCALTKGTHPRRSVAPGQKGGHRSHPLTPSTAGAGAKRSGHDGTAVEEPGGGGPQEREGSQQGDSLRRGPGARPSRRRTDRSQAGRQWRRGAQRTGKALRPRQGEGREEGGIWDHRDWGPRTRRVQDQHTMQTGSSSHPPAPNTTGDTGHSRPGRPWTRLWRPLSLSHGQRLAECTFQLGLTGWSLSWPPWFLGSGITRPQPW